MKIAIISDTHDNLFTLNKALSWINKEKIDTIIHCGDLLRMDTLKKIVDNFKGDIYIVSGDPDDVELKKPKKLGKTVNICGQVGGLLVENMKIGFTHKPQDARRLAKKGVYNLVFHGHTHKPWEEVVNGCKLVNPGNLAGIYYKATFAVLDTESGDLSLKILEKI